MRFIFVIYFNLQAKSLFFLVFIYLFIFIS